MAGSTRCMVTAQTTMHSASAVSSARAASPRWWPASSHRPARCMSSTGWKSTERVRMSAERQPPRRSRTASLIIR
ncbi:hypothetical protein AKJ13_03610 [Methylobacterium sp. ARG-1]|nr:hypothetical protein AKJ13_03610 [Methylobacterium sp. ARG-1]